MQEAHAGFHSLLASFTLLSAQRTHCQVPDLAVWPQPFLAKRQAVSGNRIRQPDPGAAGKWRGLKIPASPPDGNELCWDGKPGSGGVSG